MATVSINAQGYQPVARSPSDGEKHHGLERIQTQLREQTDWLRTNQSRLQSVWSYSLTSKEVAVQLSPDETSLQATLVQETIAKIKTFLNLENPQETKSWIMQLIETILRWLGVDTTAKDIFLEKMNKDLDGGCCHGISLALMHALSKNPTMSMEEAISQISKEDIVLLQVLSNLRVEVYQAKKAAQQEQKARVHQRSQTKNLTLSPEENAYEESLRTKIREGTELLGQIDTAIEQLCGSNFEGENTETKEKRFTSSRSGHSSSEVAASYLLSETNQNARVVISIHPKKEGSEQEDAQESKVGHSIFVDLKNNAFFDINSGYYQYSSKGECIAAVQKLIAQDYKELTGAWTMRIVRSPKPKPAPKQQTPVDNGGPAQSRRGSDSSHGSSSTSSSTDDLVAAEKPKKKGNKMTRFFGRMVGKGKKTASVNADASGSDSE